MKTMNKILFLVLLFPFYLCAAGNAITGRVTISDSKQALAQVIVKIQGSRLSTQTDSSGRYLLNQVPAGKHYLLFIKKGFYSLVVPDVKTQSGSYTVLNAQMYPGDSKEYLFLEIGGIQVTAQRNLLSEEPETVHRITGGEIEHMQANSLADVLDMIPGNEKTGNLGLRYKQQINLRSFGTDRFSSFGTRVIIDDVPLTNNADLQTGVGVGYGTSVTTNSGWGYDLREVVADNLAKVDVASGASSVEYGDHTAGVILVQTKMKNVPTRLKLKSNPDTREANLMGSFHLGKTNLVYNLNYGYSERNIRIKGDEYHRIAASLKSQNTFWNKRLRVRQYLKYNRRLEENNYKIDTTATLAYNRDHHLTYSQQFDFKWNDVTDVYWRNYVDYKHRNSWKYKLESADVSYLSNRMTAGTSLADTSKPVYHSNVRTIGDEFSYGSKLRLRRKWFIGAILHRFLIGSEFQTDKNTGPGKTFDVLRPPNGALHSRPRRFDAIPGITQMAFFFEDRLTGKLFLPFTFDVGFRLDSYNPTALKLKNLFTNNDVFAAKQGTFFNPRLGLKVNLFSKTQLRFTFSKTSKTPALSSIYPEPYYLDVNDLLYQTVQGSQGQDSVVVRPLLMSTYIYERSVPHLKGYQTTKYEAGFDQQWGNFAISLVGYFKQTKNFPKSINAPFYYNRYLWPNWPESSGKESVERILFLTSFSSKSKNLGWAKSSGFEFSLRTHRIPSLNMRFRISAAFNFRKEGSTFYPVYYRTETVKACDSLSTGWIFPKDIQIVPYYSPNESWRQRMIVKYNVDYIAKPLGIWLTLRAEQVLWDQTLNVSHAKLAAQGYYYNGSNVPINAETSQQLNLNRRYSNLDVTVDKSKPNNKWLFSIIVSKALFKGAEVSLFVNNFLNDRAYYINRYGFYEATNPAMFWGMALSSKIDGLFK